MANPFKDYIVKLRAGDLVFKEGDPGTEMYIVQSGRVEVFNETSPRGEVSLAVMEKGDFFGEMALLDGAPHGASARAVDDVELIEINSTLFDRMIKGNVEIAVRMLRKLSIRLRETNRKYEAQLAAPEADPGASKATRAPVPAPSIPAAPPAEGARTKAPPVMQTRAEPVELAVEAAVAPAAAVASEPSPPPPRPAAPAAGADGCHAFLHSEDGMEKFALTAAKAVLGRFDPVTGLKPEVDLSNVDINRSVSRRHARLNLEGGIYYLIEEPGALNGTFINGRKLITGKPTRLKDGDAVNLGTVKLVFRETGKA
jgi:hypothetical protein